MKKILCLCLVFVFLLGFMGCEKNDSDEKNKDAKNTSDTLEFELSEDKKSYAVVGIGDFKGTDLTIPDTYKGLPVTQIKDFAFYSETKVSTLTIGKNITNIGYSAFYGCCEGLKKVIFNAKSCNDLESSPFNALTTNTLTVEIGKDVERIPSLLFGAKDFDFAPSIGELRFSNESNCKEISKYAFHRTLKCSFLTLPQSVETIGEKAFSSCDSLIQITLPQNLKSIEFDAFSACTKLVEIYNPSSLNIELGKKENGQIAFYALTVHSSLSDASILTNKNDFIFVQNDDKNYLIAYVGNSKNITLPSDFNGASYGLYEYAFYYSTIESVVIPKNVESIGFNAFGICSNLKYATFEDPNGWYYKSYLSKNYFDAEKLKDSVVAAEMLGGGSYNFSSYDSETWYKELIT